MAEDAFERALEQSDEVELTTMGRRSGAAITVPVWFAREGERLYLVPVHGSESDWYQNALKTPAVRLAVGGARLDTRASAVTEQPEVQRILDRFRAKYGADDVANYYPQQDVAVLVPLR
jgi:deazaflavin-dependent oxidoreductase (nitroreductase family)